MDGWIWLDDLGWSLETLNLLWDKIDLNKGSIKTINLYCRVQVLLVLAVNLVYDYNLRDRIYDSMIG
jgi:hypothetical protein